MAFEIEKVELGAPKKCVSVGILVNNPSKCPEESILSALRQAECLEIYVLLPTKFCDQSAKIIAKSITDPRVHFSQDVNNNIAEFANKTASHFKGEYYIFMNEEDILTEYSLKASIRHLEQPSSYALTHGLAYEVDKDFGNRRKFRSLNQSEDTSSFAKGKSMALATILMKRSAWLLLAGFNGSLKSGFELDFAIRAYKAFSKRICYIKRIQAHITKNFDENMPSELLLNRIFENYLILKNHNLNSVDFLENSLTNIISRLSSINELKNFFSETIKCMDENSQYLYRERQETVIKSILFDKINIDTMALMEAQEKFSYEEDSLAGGLIACISLEMYSGYFANAKGPYATYASLRSSYADSIKYVKELEKCSLIVKKRNISGGFRDKPFGVNLIGHAFDVFGLGEALRTIARALIDAEIPLNVIDVPACNGCHRENNFLENYIDSEFEGMAPYAFNIVCMSPSSHAKWLLNGGINLSIGRYSISAWFWETSTWPSPWINLFQFIDAAWAFSSIIYEALTPHCDKNKFILEKTQFPAEICVGEILDKKDSKRFYRSKFNLPKEDVIFIFGFDPKSQIERKNPVACITVFHDAFGSPLLPNYKKNVCLVIKTFKPETENQEWNTLISLVSADKRIILIIDSLERTDLLQLYSCCDVFLSLHRSEGYGLGIAEALQLGLKVVVTGYGGNIDFCKGESAYLVDYKLVPIIYGDYPFSRGHYWAEPNLKNAADICQKVVKDIKVKSMKMDDTFKDVFSIKISGQAYKRSLTNTYKNIH